MPRIAVMDLMGGRSRTDQPRSLHERIRKRLGWWDDGGLAPGFADTG